MPAGLGAIGFYYTDFHQMSDDEVTDTLAQAMGPAGKALPKPTTSTNWRDFLARHLKKSDRGSEPAREDHSDGR